MKLGSVQPTFGKVEWDQHGVKICIANEWYVCAMKCMHEPLSDPD